jgi:hypothetical protein
MLPGALRPLTGAPPAQDVLERGSGEVAQRGLPVVPNIIAQRDGHVGRDVDLIDAPADLEGKP